MLVSYGSGEVGVFTANKSGRNSNNSNHKSPES